MSFIIGIDPGDSTGLALFIDGNFITAHQGTPGNMLAMLEILLSRAQKNGAPATVAIERFTSNQRVTTHQPTAQQVIGATIRACEIYGATLKVQGAADARGLMSNEELRRIGLWQSGRDVDQPDANDANMAVRHALLTLMREHATQFEALINP